MSITRINPTASDQLIVERVYAESKSYAANTVTTVSFNVAKTGYRALGVVGHVTSVGAAYLSWATIMPASSAGTSYTASIGNRSSNAITSVMSIYVLYVKE